MTLEQSISRRSALAQLGLAAVAAPSVLRGRFGAFTHPTTEYSARCIKLIEENVVVDLLNQFRFQDFAEKPPRIDRWLTQPGSLTAADADIYRGSKMTAVALGHAPGSYEEGIRFFADWNGLVAGYSDWFTRIDDASDFRASEGVEQARHHDHVPELAAFPSARRREHVLGTRPARVAAHVQHEQRHRQWFSRAARRRTLGVRAYRSSSG
jgi:hypothetical protein